MSVAVAIMHVPSARGRAEIVQRQLGLWPDARVIEDPHREGVWPTARRGWEWLASTSASHVLLMQDDAIPCFDMPQQVLAARDAIPRGVLCFYTRRAKSLAAAKAAGSSWYWTPDDAYGQALLMPREWVPEMLDWIERRIEPSYKHDDNRVGLWARFSGRGVYVSCPSLVSHARVPSVLGHYWSDVPGLAWRDDEPGPIDWTRGVANPPRSPMTVKTRGVLRDE